MLTYVEHCLSGTWLHQRVNMERCGKLYPKLAILFPSINLSICKSFFFFLLGGGEVFQFMNQVSVAFLSCLTALYTLVMFPNILIPFNISCETNSFTITHNYLCLYLNSRSDILQFMQIVLSS